MLLDAQVESTLVVVLFTGASRMDLGTVLREHHLALRLLGIGLPVDHPCRAQEVRAPSAPPG